MNERNTVKTNLSGYLRINILVKLGILESVTKKDLLMKKLLIVLFGFALNTSIAQNYTDYIGAGHSDGITVTTSNQSGSGTAQSTIDGTGMQAHLFEASRFLAQATFGSTQAEIEALGADLDFEAWIDAEFTKPQTEYYSKMQEIWAEILAMREAAGEDISDIFGPYGLHFNYTWMQNTIEGEDYLRQRVAFALSQILVISNESDLRDHAEATTTYYDLLMTHAFGNYEDLLLDVTTSLAMGYYLSHLNNPKEDVDENIHPDQNYAREIMQLFSIGLYELNLDGTRKKDADGNDIPTYDQEDIVEMANVFTGLGPGGIEDYVDWTTVPYFGLGFWGASKTDPMIMYDDHHETKAKVLLKDVTLPANQAGMTDIEQTVEYLFNHENTAPFISRRLIQRFIKSNPTKEYIARVATVFNDNGSGVRGDMKAIIKAIFLDEEARECAPLQDEFSPRLREPILRYTHIAKALDKDSPFGRYWANGYTFNDQAKQAPLWSPTVFNFYLPDHFPVGLLSGNGYSAPEFKLHNTQTATGYINAVNAWTIWDGLMYSWEGAYGDVGISLLTPDLEALAYEPEKLINELDVRFTHGQLTDETRTIIRDAITPITWSDWEKTRLALYLVFISPDYNIMR